MADYSQLAPASVPEATEARFTIRSLFVAMAVVAVIAALAGPLVRRLPPDSQIRLLIAWGLWLAASIAWIGYQARKRFEAERLAGRTILRLPMFDERVPNVTPFRRRLNVVLTGFMTLMMMFAISEMALNPPPGQVSLLVVFNFGFTGLMCIWWTLRVATSLWWRTNVRFGERGILWDRRVVLWDHVVSCTWDSAAPTVLEVSGIDQHNIDMNLKVSVPAANREVVESLIELKVVQKPAVAILSPMNQLGSLPLSVAARDSRFPKYIGFIFLFILAMILGPYLFRGGLTGIHEFDQSAFWGFILGGIVKSLSRWSRAIQVGAPLVRLTTKRAWLLALAAAAAASSAYWIGYTLGSTSELLAYASGIGFGGFVSTAITCLMRKQFDMRANGIFTQGSFWPWNEIRLLKWNMENGQLALGSGWRRLYAIVPPEQREAVDRVLREKVIR